MPVPLGYSSTLGTMDLLDLSIDLTALGEDDNAVEIDQAMQWIHLQHTANIHYKHTKKKPTDYEAYQPFLGFKPLEVIQKTFDATTQWAAPTFTTPLKKHYKS
jgi:hypothetical protein